MTTLTQDILDTIKFSNKAQRTKEVYRRTITRYVNFGNDIGNIDHAKNWALSASDAARAFFRAALKLHIDKLRLSDPDHPIAANLARVVRVVPAAKGTRREAHQILTPGQIKSIKATCDMATPKGLRDYVTIGLMLKCGLSRAEVITATFSDLVSQDNDYWLSVKNSTGTYRHIPLNNNFAGELERWQRLIKGTDRSLIVRPISKGGKVGDKVSSVTCYEICASAGQAAGLPAITPETLRRTFGQMHYESAGIEHASLLLGHANIATTQKYLGVSLGVDKTKKDVIPF